MVNTAWNLLKSVLKSIIYPTFLTRIFSTYFPHQSFLLSVLFLLGWFNFLHSADISWILWYEVAIFLSWYTNKYRVGFFFFFSVINVSSSCFSCIDWSVAERGFRSLLTDTQLCWESRSYCLVSVHNKHILVHYWANKYCWKLSCPQGKPLFWEIAIFSSIGTGWMLLSGVPTNSTSSLIFCRQLKNFKEWCY